MAFWAIQKAMRGQGSVGAIQVYFLGPAWTGVAFSGPSMVLGKVFTRPRREFFLGDPAGLYQRTIAM